MFNDGVADAKANEAALAEILADGEGEVVIAVHGTFAADPSNEGAQWWQRGSAFMTRLTSALQVRLGRAPKVLPFHWSGENSEFDRLAAGRALEKVMRRLEKAGRPYHVIAHSHGGNVIVLALCRFARIGRKYPHLRSVTTFGSPYFRRKLKPLSKAFLAYRLTLLVCFFLPGLIFALAAPLILLTIAAEPGAAAMTAGIAVGTAAAAALFFAPSWFLWRSIAPMAREKARLLKSVRKSELGGRWLAIWTRRDEAIGLLSRATAFKPKFITPRSMARTLGRLSSFVAGVVVAGAAIGTITFARPITEWLARMEQGAEAKLSIGVDDVNNTAAGLFILFFLQALPLFAVVHLGLSFFFRLGPHRAAAWFMNDTIVGGVRTGVFGDDAHFKLTGVGPTPERITVKTKELVGLEGVDDADAVAAAHALYTELIELNPEGESKADPAGVWDRLSHSMYHNSYFVDDAVMVATVDHIAEQVASAAAPAARASEPAGARAALQAPTSSPRARAPARALEDA